MDSNTRQRMRPWLEAKVEAGNIAGLQWIDKSKKIFRVPWKHGGKHDWNEADSQIFKEWAVHTGRFREGVDTPDWPVWKTRFRCALNKLPDIEELKEHSRLEGTDPYRAYRFLNNDEKMKKKKKEISNGDMCIKHVDLIAIQPTPGASNVMPNFIPNLPNLPSDLDDITVEPLKSDSHGDNRTIVIKDESEEDMDTSDIVTGATGTQDTEMNYMDDMAVKYQDNSDDVIYIGRGAGHTQLKTSQLNNFSINNVREPCDHEMHIKVRYCQHEVASFEVSNNFGCRLFYAGQQGDQNRGDTSGIQDISFFGSPNLQQLSFPPIQLSYNHQQQEHTMQLLNALDRGLILESENGCIYATRKSRCVIFIATPINGGEPFKLQRDERTKVFDYKNNFNAQLQQYFINHGNKPSPYFLIGFGQKINTPNLSHSNLLISAVVYHSKSMHMLNQVSCSSPLSPPIQMSGSDEFDKFLHHLRAVQNIPTFLAAK